MQVPF